MEKDPFEILKNVTTAGSSNEFNNALSGIYVLALTIATIGIVLSIIICGIKLVSFKNGGARDEAKKELFWKVLLGILIFSFTGIIALAYGISQKFIY